MWHAEVVEEVVEPTMGVEVGVVHPLQELAEEVPTARMDLAHFPPFLRNQALLRAFHL